MREEGQNIRKQCRKQKGAWAEIKRTGAKHRREGAEHRKQG